MRPRSIIASLFLSIFFFSCVSSKKYKQAQTDYANLQVKQSQLEGDLSNCNTEKANLARQNQNWKMTRQILIAASQT